LTLVAIQSVFHFAAWEENHTHVLRKNIGDAGVNEFALASIIVYIITYFLGYEIWDIQVYQSIVLRDL